MHFAHSVDAFCTLTLAKPQLTGFRYISCCGVCGGLEFISKRREEAALSSMLRYAWLVMISPTLPFASRTMRSVSIREHEPSSFAIPSHVAERTNRLVKDKLFIVVVSKSIGISSLHDVIAVFSPLPHSSQPAEHQST